MRYPKRITLPGIARQQGAVLLAVLVVVAIMTLSGLASMRSSNVDALLATAGRTKMEALLSAEDALIDGEEAICPHLANNPVCTGPLVTDFDEATNDGFHNGRALVDIDGISALDEVGFETVNTNKSFMIEYLDNLVPAGASLSIGTNTISDIRYVFRITAHGRSTGGGESIVQSHYAVRR